MMKYTSGKKRRYNIFLIQCERIRPKKAIVKLNFRTVQIQQAAGSDAYETNSKEKNLRSA